MQSATSGNRLIIGTVAFGVSFGLSLVLSWNFSKAFLSGLITVPATYLSVLFVDKRRRANEMIILDSLQKRIKELEVVKSRIFTEVNQLEAHSTLLYTESNKLQTQVAERLSQRDLLNRELNSFVGERNQLSAEIVYLKNEIQQLETTKAELNTSFSALAAEKRRLELNCSITRSEITQLQNQIGEFTHQKEEIESNLILLNRLKPQLEEKLHALRVEIQELESQGKKHNQLILDKKIEKKNVEASLNSLQAKLNEQKTELKQLEGQVALLQEERDQLQNQVWELLQQTETLEQELIPESNIGLLPLTNLLESLERKENIASISENLPEEWIEFLAQLPQHEIEVLKAMLKEENPNSHLKKIAEQNITMPHLLIDSINERANNTIGELIINPYAEPVEIYQEHMINVKEMISAYEALITNKTSAK
ncbi:MAG: hypothetical protein KME33_04075 [Aetokthonos hydrillicola CCALA 1050]|nr:hypothetical protein [Aetokthonos hydrillicola CCALA 1050]MBW4584393.1 hypothetical protein [Aetokthonos hydrillicola CCALA 1050]